MPPTKRAPRKAAPKPRTPAAAQKRADVKTPPGLARSDEFDCRDDGTVRWKMPNGTTYWLRNPLLGEYKELIEMLEAIQEEVSVEQERLLDIAKKAEEDGDRTALLQLSIDVGRKSREFGEQTRNGVLAWWSRVFKLLEYQGRPFPETAAPMSVLTTTQYLDDIREHWNRPSHPGS